MSMEGLRELYRIGAGPSSSHTMGPQRAALLFLARHPQAPSYRVTLLGSLAATGRGHLTDVGLKAVFGDRPFEIVWRADDVPAFHPNGMTFEALDASGQSVSAWRVYSVGGGAIREDGAPPPPSVYPLSTMDEILAWCETQGEPLWRYAEVHEGAGIWSHLDD